jgi:acyl dehydratase
MGISVQPVIEWVGDAAKVTDYGVRFTKPVVVPPNGHAELFVKATIAQLDEENQKVRVDLTTSFEETTVLGKAQVWVQL